MVKLPVRLFLLFKVGPLDQFSFTLQLGNLVSQNENIMAGEQLHSVMATSWQIQRLNAFATHVRTL